MYKLLLLFTLFTVIPAWGGGDDELLPLNKQYLQEVVVNEVHPTQGVLGMIWKNRKKRKFSKMSPDELAQRLKSEAPPAIVGPGKVIWLLDHHHEFRAVQELGIEYAWVTIVGDFHKLDKGEFEKAMKNFVYLGDAEGKMTFKISTLPERVSEIKQDDPYRSLVSFLRRAGGYLKTGLLHTDFAWANGGLREWVSVSMIENNLERAVEIGLEFCASDEAKRLPGYINIFKGSKKRDCEVIVEGQAQL